MGSRNRSIPSTALRDPLQVASVLIARAFGSDRRSLCHLLYLTLHTVCMPEQCTDRHSRCYSCFTEILHCILFSLTDHEFLTFTLSTELQCLMNSFILYDLERLSSKQFELEYILVFSETAVWVYVCFRHVTVNPDAQQDCNAVLRVGGTDLPHVWYGDRPIIIDKFVLNF